ncbi:NAD-dependent epimerase/dehydratase family protein [Sediminicoccus sp. KRV36]|uniref:NAD-dependent epimerase/dehydratase family protein n=1 Tax=Sediminicoccus sp. KRV36 TaxID=3133721 RepID=UPI00200DDABC|nr:NAD-dependent epimerase/dehydratase family protein [Sediminicoccus rosea]UPY39130.1 NAD-dependent epimerase/dehydratase family protein [Sediminicoccus rosea]
MQITILGGGGFLGRKFAERLAAEGHLGGQPVTSLVLFDLAAPRPLAAPFPVTCLGGDVASLADVSAAIPPGTSLVVHLAAVVSAAAEADFDLGMRVNLHGTLTVIEACRKLAGPAIHGLAAPPRVLFTSSVASFGGGQAALLPDDARQIPTNSYGAQKAAAELLLQDASRKGFLDAVSIRLPTVIVRPGRPNKAASSFFSAILREPLLGLETPLPVGEDFRVWVCSPRRAVDWLFHAAVMETAPLGVDRGINPPGLAVSVGEMLAALSPAERALVKREPDAAIAGIVGGWPAEFTATRARALGFTPQEGVPQILAAFREDDLAATRAERGL